MHIPHCWKSHVAAHLCHQSGYSGLVRSTNKIKLELQPFETVTVSGLVRKERGIESAVTEQTEKASSKIGVCPRVVAMDKPGKYARVPVRIFNMSAEVMTIPPKSVLCQLQEVKVLRICDFVDDKFDMASSCPGFIQASTCMSKIQGLFKDF